METARRLFAHRLGETSLETALRMVPTLVCLLAIYQGSSVEGSDVPSIVIPILGHLVEYFALGLSLAIAAAGFTTTRVSAVGYLSAWCVAMVWALSDEWHQSFVPGRFPSAADLMVDAIGAAAGLALASVMASRGDHVR